MSQIDRELEQTEFVAVFLNIPRASRDETSESVPRRDYSRNKSAAGFNGPVPVAFTINAGANPKGIKFSFISHPRRELSAGRNRSIFSAQGEATTFRKVAFSREECLVSTRYYASRRHNSLEAYAGQACPRPSFVRSFARGSCIYAFPPARCFLTRLRRTHTRRRGIVCQTIYMYCSSMMCRKRWPAEGRTCSRGDRELLLN